MKVQAFSKINPLFLNLEYRVFEVADHIVQIYTAIFNNNNIMNFKNLTMNLLSAILKPPVYQIFSKLVELWIFLSLSCIRQ